MWPLILLAVVMLGLAGAGGASGWARGRNVAELGSVWGEQPSSPPAGWDPNSNAVYIGSDCSFVLEGRRFLPPVDPKGEFGYATLRDNLAEGNTAWAYVHYLRNTSGMPDENAGERLGREAVGLCGPPYPPGGGNPAIREWIADVRRRVVEEGLP
ncbi:MAG: hypothetical protein K0U78_16335 [Actinomycetia bacterium]|nr:hypothetical protein [Actinomycetes bacterium]